MSRAVSIRSQLKKYMMRFDLPTQSCEGDGKRVRQCLVSGYWRNGARWMADGTYRSVRNDQVSVNYVNTCGSPIWRRFYMFTRRPCYLPGSRVPVG